MPEALFGKNFLTAVALDRILGIVRKLRVAHQNQPAESFRADDWNNWAEEPMIELCEVRVGFDEAVMSECSCGIST